MHAKYHRISPGRATTEVEKSGLKDNFLAERQVLSGPVTLTVTLVRPPSGLPSGGPIATPSTSSLDPLETLAPPIIPIPSTLMSITSSGHSTVPSQSLTPVSSSPTISFASPSIAAVPNVPDADGKLAESSKPVTISSGTIVGIVIGCVGVLLAAVLVGLRKRSVRNRLKLRGTWANSGLRSMSGNRRTMTHYPGVPEGSDMNRSMGSPAMGYIGRPISVNTTINGTPTSGFPQPLPSAYGADFSGTALSPQKPVLYSVAVARSFIPTLPDELSISTGDILKVVQEFDDGWAECMTSSGETGMVPLECFDKREGHGGVDVGRTRTEEMTRNSRRFSSLPSARR